MNPAPLPVLPEEHDPARATFGCVALRCTLSAGWCGARWKRAQAPIGWRGRIADEASSRHPAADQACRTCELGREHAPLAQKARERPMPSNREKAIRAVDALRTSRARERGAIDSRRIEVREGDRYGRWTIVREIASGTMVRGDGETRKVRRVVVRCECGREAEASLANLRHGKTTGCRSCGSKAWRRAKRG